MYCSTDFKTKKALKEAVVYGEEISIFSPGPFPANCTTGRHTVEGPHYPKPHSWYATVEVIGGIIVRVS